MSRILLGQIERLHIYRYYFPYKLCIWHLTAHTCFTVAELPWSVRGTSLMPNVKAGPQDFSSCQIARSTHAGFPGSESRFFRCFSGLGLQPKDQARLPHSPAGPMLTPVTSRSKVRCGISLIAGAGAYLCGRAFVPLAASMRDVVFSSPI